jgi:hypothetical protein
LCIVGWRRGIGHEQRPPGIGWREADVHDHHLAAPIAREQVAAARATEGDRALRADGPVGLAARHVEAGRPVDREDGRAAGRELSGERQDVALGGPRGAGAEQGVYRHGRLRPRLLAPHLTHAIHARQRAVVDGVVGLGIHGRDPHGDARGVQRAREHPAVAAVVARAGGDEHSPLGGEFGDEDLRRRAPRRLHEDAAGHAILRARRGIPRRRFGRRQHRNWIHGITTPA